VTRTDAAAVETAVICWVAVVVGFTRGKTEANTGIEYWLSKEQKASYEGYVVMVLLMVDELRGKGGCYDVARVGL
jgi:hypothetical protein